MSPILDDVKSKVGAMVTILKIDVDKNQALASRFKIKSVPTLLLFKKGEIIWKKSGIVSSSELKDILLKSS
jgi:thioredoxin 1